jgi:membrane-bound lytic murein transglycosylase D
MLRMRPGRTFGLLVLVALTASGCAPRRPTVVAMPVPGAAEPEDLGEAPELVVGAVRDVARELLGDVDYDLPVVANSWVAAELEFLVSQRREVIGRWLQRGDPYEHEIKEILRGHGLPADLYHLAMIESGFVPTARSRAGAVGLWQFMPATGRDVGLRVDSMVDERMDPIRSTHAAARHLRALIRIHGDWELAAAAYNAGSGRIGRGLQRFGVSNFWDLAVQGDLAEETKHYVPRLYAMTIIARDRTRFGFPERTPESRSPFRVDSVVTDLATPVAELARIGGLAPESIERLNPHLLRRSTPPGRYKVWVPAGTGAALQQAYLGSEFRRNQGQATYVVRRGDSLGRIAQRAGLRGAEVRTLNPGVDFDALKAGERLRLPALAVQRIEAAATTAASAAAPVAAAEAPRAAAAPPRAAAAPAAAPAATARRDVSANTVAHEVASGETLWAIARRYEVSVSEIEKASGLQNSAIRVGQRLSIPAAAGAATASAARPAAGAAPKAAEHVVRSGETLWSIAREYGSTVDSIQTANRIPDQRIVPGQRLLIPLSSR